MENNVVLNGASAPKTKLLTILTVIFGGLIVTMGLFEYICVQFGLVGSYGILQLDYNGLNAHEIIFNLMFATLVVVTIAKNKQRRFNGWLVLAAMCTFLSSPYWGFRHSLFIANLDLASWEQFLDVYVYSYALLTLCATYGVALLPLLWRRNKWSIAIAISVGVMILGQRIVAFVAESGAWWSWYEIYGDTQYTFGFLVFYNLMPILITLFLFYVMLRDAITEGVAQPEKKEESATPVNTVYCRNCGKPHAEEAEFCMSCGVRAGVGGKYCRVCGAKPDPLAEICVKCGTVLNK